MEAGKMAHSHSQPGGMDRTPPGTPKKGGKMLAVRVQMLDDTVTIFQVQAKALGRVLFDQVCNQLNLLEADYFGLEYQEAGGTKYWLDLEKPLCRQIGLSLVDTLVRFCVKFYTPDPSQLEEEFTRYLFCLQIKRDLSQGLLQCNSNTAALMASYIVQAECGDYVVEDYPDHRYLSSYKFVPNQDQELERRIMENHKKHAGQSPAEADLNLLETARRCELYGIKMHPAKDHEGCPLNLAVAHMGIVVFQNFSKINTFSWAKIRKISFKRKRFLVKLHPEGYGYYKDTVEFFFEGRNECKNFWKKCVENHGFFRCTMVKKVPRQKTRVLSRGSSFRYSGRTQKQIVDFVRENYVKRQTFQRSQSFRHSSSAHSSVANVGTSISAHPLLPLGDNAVVGTPASLSCGSMTLTSSPVHAADIHAGASPSPPLTTSVSPGTSVTSSPQHFYPQETHYRRAGHPPMKVKHPPVRTLHAISPLLSPTDAAKAASNRSANHSNNGAAAAVDNNDTMSSRNSLKSPEFVDFNDVYSNCYSTLRRLSNVADDKMTDNQPKTDIFEAPCEFMTAASRSNESIMSLSKTSTALLVMEDVDRYTWHRSASCRELYQEVNPSAENPEENPANDVEPTYEVVDRYSKAMRKCYSAVASKNPSIDRGGDVGKDARIFSRSYPGTTSSLSTESAEDRIIEVLDMKYDSQEEIALSHDDVSHDSYELLERELDDYNEESSRSKRSRILGDNERTRSCSWGSDRIISPLDFRSSENVVDISREQNFWSLEREKSLKHKSEIDFRSFSQKGSRQAPYNFEGNGYEVIEGQGRSPEFLDYDNRFGKRSRELDEEMFETGSRKNQPESRIFSSKGVCKDLKVRRASREEKENFEGFEKKKCQSQRKSLEHLAAEGPERKRVEKRREKREERFHEGLKEKEQKEWEREKERRQMDRRKSAEEKDLRGGEPATRKPSDYVNFQEIHFKKFERVVSNQFGKYPEFLSFENTYDFLTQEKKVIENYEKVCQVSRLAKELKKNEKNCTALGEGVPDTKRKDSPEVQERRNVAPEFTTKSGRALVERTKSDPYGSLKNHKRNLLMHQKSIDLTPQQSEETASDYDNEDGLKKTSRSEHDIPYILHKRHCMNGTAKTIATAKASLKPLVGEIKPLTEKKPSAEEVKTKPPHTKLAEAKKAGVQIINLDVKNGKIPVNVGEVKKSGKLKPVTGKKPETKPGSPKPAGKKEGSKFEHSPPKTKTADGKVSAEGKDKEEPIYAEVCPEKFANGLPPPLVNVPPEPPKRTSSYVQKQEPEKTEKVQPAKKVEDSQMKMKNGQTEGPKPGPVKSGKQGEGPGKGPVRGKQDGAVLQRREESLTLFARTRLGLSEGSAFAPIVRQGRVGSPSSQRRAKSLDAPYVSVHSLPPADAFSSKDDTVDGGEGDIVDPAVAKFEEFCKGEAKKGHPALDTLGNTESEVDSVFTDDLEMESNFKKTVESQSKVEMPFVEEKVLDGVRGKRLLSKIESVDVIDSEGDLDSSKLAEPPPIPSDRLVNLPESIRFPSVRQISGQTSEESADGWDQREVKVKRRTPRRSVGREEQDARVKDSVVWDSKDDEPPDDDVWDDNLPQGGSVSLPTEYLKRGSCGQSIDDDNLSTPMKESSPEHWVSVDDLPEALEREEKLLRQQEKILREKILNEKLKRELNLDTIDVDERYCDYKHSRYDDEPGSLKENFKGHSLDTYELNEKKLRERGGNKNSSLDEGMLPNRLIQSYVSLEPKEKLSMKTSNYQEGLDYIQCKVVKDVTEIDQFGDNDEELEEFFVVLDENLGKEGRSMIWDDEDSFRKTLSLEESLISVPEEFKDVEKEDESFREEGVLGGKVEILLSKVEDREGKSREQLILQEKLNSLEEEGRTGEASDDRLSFSGSRRDSEENRKLIAEDTGRLSPYDSSRRSSDDPRRFSASDDAGCLSPSNSSRRGSEDPRRPSTSEDSRKCSASESVSEETRRRLSSTEETRRKRASLTKQCSVGAESLSDELISGIQECSSSFEQDEREVFESEPVKPKTVEPSSGEKGQETPKLRQLEIEVCEEKSTDEVQPEVKSAPETNAAMHLVPPTSERELSRETEDSVDYGEGDFKDIRDVVKEKDISDGLICDDESIRSGSHRLPSSFERSETSEGDELRYIDDKRGSTPEILVGKSKEDVSMSIVVVNEGITVLNKIKEREAAKCQSLPRGPPPAPLEEGRADDDQRHTLPKAVTKPKPKPKPLTPKPVGYVHRKLTKAVPEIKVKGSPSPSGESSATLKGSLDSSQESDLDGMSDLSLVSHVQSQIARRNLSDAGRCLRRDGEFADYVERKTSSEEDAMLPSLRTSSEEKEKTGSSSFELKSSAEELAVGEDPKRKRPGLKPGMDASKAKKEGSTSVKEKRSPDQEKRDSGEDGSSSSSAPLYPKRELSSTWKPFLLESSGSSSLEEGWLPPDENAHLADEEETSSTSNNQQDDSIHDDADYPTGIGYPILNISSAEMMVGGYGSVYSLSRTLSRISERSTSEQERSDLEDDITKPSSHSVSAEEESILSSDHQPSLSSDPPSPKESASTIPDLPVDKPLCSELFGTPETPVCEPFGDIIPPPLPEEDWPSPPSSFSVADTPVVSHVETIYMEIHPEEACKVVVAAEPHEEGNSSSDENQTLQEESEFLHLSSDNMSASTTTTTQDGTVVFPVRPMAGRTGSLSEDISLMSASEWSSPSSGKPRPSQSDDALQDRPLPPPAQGEISTWSSPSKYCLDGYFDQDAQKPKPPTKVKPLKLSSPTTKTLGFFETPISKVRSPTSTIKFFEGGHSSVRSPTSFSETTSPKSYGRFFEGQTKTRSPSKHRGVCAPYYSNVAESAEKSYFGRYDTGSLERTKIQHSRKCSSYYSVSKTVPNDGDSSNSDGPPAPSPNTIPRASKKTKRRHRVAMDLVVRDGKIVAPPKTKATVVENSDSDRSSPRDFHRRKQSDV